MPPKYHRTFVWLILVLAAFAACSPAATKLVEIPTLAVLPTFTPSPTETPAPTATLTPNLLETQVVELNATNAAAQSTLDMLLTQNAPTSTSAVTLTPSETITDTLTPSTTPNPVVEMQPQPLYVQSTANLRTCAQRDCERIAQLQPGEALMATGTIEGEAITSGKPLWYRVEYLGRELYVYSELVSTTAPALPTGQPVSVAPPPSGSGSCPSLSATCSEMTCEQAYACLAAGNTNLDRDHDGIPCESVCNK